MDEYYLCGAKHLNLNEYSSFSLPLWLFLGSVESYGLKTARSNKLDSFQSSWIYVYQRDLRGFSTINLIAW